MTASPTDLGLPFGSVVRLGFVVRARIAVISFVLLGCNADAHEPPKIEEQLSRIEARLDRIDEHLRSSGHTEIVADAGAIDLPKAGASPTRASVAVTISPTLLSINGEAVADVALRARLEQLAATSPNASVVIHAEPTVEHGRVVYVMDTVKKAGFSRIATAVAASERSED